MIIALAILGMAIMFMSTDLIASASGTLQSQTRLNAEELASKTLQQVESLGYGSASEGVACSSSACTALKYSDPNGNVTSGGDGCFYFGPASNKLLVPTQYTSATTSSDVPIDPNVSSANSTLYPSPTVNGVTYTVATYPMFDENAYSSATPTVNCTNLTNGTAADIPLTIVVEVSWGSNNSQHVSMQTVLYAPPPQSISAGNCPTPAAEQGAHNEQLLANQEDNGTLSTTAYVGDTLSVMFLDEAPTPYSPAFCVVDSSGNTVEMQTSQLRGYTVTQLGTSQSQPYYSGTITSVHPKWQAGSGPNAAAPPTGGTYCTTTTTTSNCNAEVVYSFQLPTSDGVASISSGSSITVAVWDHEGDLDFATWTVQ